MLYISIRLYHISILALHIIILKYVPSFMRSSILESVVVVLKYPPTSASQKSSVIFSCSCDAHSSQLSS